MAGEQTVTIAQTTNTTVKVVVNAIGSSGSHVALVVDSSTTRLDGRSEVPTVYYPTGSTGIAEIRFSVTSTSLTEFTTLICKVNGTADGVVFSEYAIPVKVLESQLDTKASMAPSVWGATASTYSIPVYSGSFGARLQESAETYLSNIGLDHFVSSSVTGADVADNSIAARLVSKSATADWDSYDNTTDSLEAIGDAAFDPTTDTVARVTLVDTTTANTDMRGTDGANTVTPDNTSITAIKAKTDQLAFTVANQVDANSLTGGTSPADIYTYFTAGTNEDVFKADISTLATSAALSGVETKIDTVDAIVDSILVDTGTDIPASISELNDFDPVTDQVIVSQNNDKTGYALSSAANDAIGAAFLSYTLTKGSAGTIERAFWQSLKASQLADGEVSGTPTSSAFDTNLTAVSGAYDHLLLLFTSGSLAGEARPIDSYSATNGRITLQEPLTSAPSSSDEFIVVPSHTDPPEDTAAAVWSYATRTVTSGVGTPPADTYAYFVQGGNEDAFKADVSALASQSSVNTVSGNVNSVKSKTDQLSFTVANLVDSNALSGGGGSNVGSGAISHEITVNVGGSPSDGVEVWVTTDSSGTNVVAGTLVTDAFGKASFMLDAGSYYLWAQKSGANFTNPTSFSVS